MIKVTNDYFDNPLPLDFVLTKANRDRIGVLQCSEKTADIKYNDLNQVNFTTYLYIDNEKNIYYDSIDVMKYLLIPDVGFFSITDCDTHSEGTEFEYKSVTAKSYECLMADKYLENFVINMGTVESIDGVQFYNIGDKSHSLLHLVLEKCPDWTVGHIDSSLVTMERSFEISRQDVYSFLMDDVAAAFECVFIFDTLSGKINIYRADTYGEDSDIHVSYNNLLKSTDISCSTDQIKTCLTITGADDLNIREINMGYEKIYNFDYYNSLEYMSNELYRAYNAWVALRNQNSDAYTSLLSQYQNYYKNINYLTSEKMPDEPGSTDWTQYGLNPLKEQLSVYEQKQSVSMKAGHGDSSSSFYASEYLPIYNSIISIKKQIAIVENEIKTLKAKQDSINAQMNAIIRLVSMENNFSEDELKELSAFIKEDELNSSNFVVTETMTDDERFDMLNQLLQFGKEELLKASTPQLSFSVDMTNIFALKDFSKLYGKFEVGNYIWVTLRDDYHIKAKLLTMHFNLFDPTDFSVTFGNIARRAKTRYTDITEMIKEGASAATSLSFHSSFWSQSAKDTSDIGNMLNEGLLSAGKYISTSTDHSDFIIDSRGLFVNTTTGTYADKDSIFIGGGKILFTDDNWKTVAMAVGRTDVKGESRFGVFADFCIASYIAGSTMEGGTITGTAFNNGNGTFSVDANGNLIAKSATIKGTIQADEGYIGGANGFTIKSGKFYSGSKTAFSSSNSGVYIGTDGISLGTNNPFSVDANGNLIAKSGTIGGIKIGANKIYADNFEINNSGQAAFKHVTITGVQSGSSFGSIGYDGTTTWGNLGGNSYYGSSAASPFYGNCVSHIQSISADYIYANYLRAINANIDDLQADYANISNLVAQKASISQLNAVNADIETLKSSNISCSRLTAGSVNGHNVSWQLISYCYSVEVISSYHTINGQTINIVTGVTPKYNNLYSLCYVS